MSEKFRVPLIHIIRNPYDVVHSQQRVKFPWLLNLNYFREQEELVQIIYSNFKFDLRKNSNLSELELLITRWCIENVIPIEILGSYAHSAKVIKLEELRNDMMQYVSLCNLFNLQPVENLSEIFSKPSTKTHPRSEIYGGGLGRKFSDTDFQKINRVLDIFQCELYPRIS